MADYKHPEWLHRRGVGPWTPGQWGKGFLHPEGLTTWGTGQSHDGYPFHSIIQGITGQGQKMAQDGTFYGQPTADIWINPDGKVAYWNRPGMDNFTTSPHLPTKDKLAQIGKQISKHDSRLTSLDGWIDDHFYPPSKGPRLWPCPRCNYQESNADGSCPNCNYRPEDSPSWERATASDPTPFKDPPPKIPGWLNWWDVPPKDERENDPDEIERRKKLKRPKVFEDGKWYDDLWEETDDPNHPGNWEEDDVMDDGTEYDWNDVTDRYKDPQKEQDAFEKHHQPFERYCPECDEVLNEHGDCENVTCYASPDFYGYKDSSYHPQVVESQSYPITIAGEHHHRQDRRPVIYLPNRNTVYVGNPACHHTQLRNEFEIPRHAGCYGYLREKGVDWLNGVGMPDEVDDVLHDRYIGNDSQSWAV